jgi:hypothetical protein
VYSSQDETDCWDGTYKGKPLPMGAYSWRLMVDLPFDEISIKEGILNIIR